MRSLQRFPTRGGQIHCPLPAIALSPLVATLTDPLASVANKRLMIRLSPLDATLTRNRGSGLPHSGTRHSSLATHHSPLQSSSLLSHSCALFCTFLHWRKTQPVSFQSLPHSLFKNTGGWGMPYILTSLPSYFIATSNSYTLSLHDALPFIRVSGLSK